MFMRKAAKNCSGPALRWSCRSRFFTDDQRTVVGSQPLEAGGHLGATDADAESWCLLLWQCTRG